MKNTVKKLTILGGGESGVGAAILAVKKGFNVFLSDHSNIKESYKNKLLKYSIEFEENLHSEKKILNSDLIIISPGISNNNKIVKKIREKKIELISEIEFANRYTNAKIIAITGSNGKTTTTLLTYYILKNAGFNVGLAGNIGNSFALQVSQEKFDYYVLEISSFQLDNCYKFKPYISTILNLSPDHLDRYNYKEKNYYHTKFKIIQASEQKDFFIINKEDSVVRQLLKNRKINVKIILFSIDNNLEYNLTTYLLDKELIIKIDPTFRINIKSLKMIGIHNISNIAVAATIAKLLKVSNREIKKSLKTFTKVEHRLEKVTKINNITFINDSKATNVNSVHHALSSIDTPIILILGGVDKGNNYELILDLVLQKVKKIICLGINNTLIKNFFESKIEVIETFSMKQCVNISFFYAQQGDTILLSPACSSFDLFKNFEDRGNQFKKEVFNLQN